MSISKYRKNPVEIEAMQWTGAEDELDTLEEWIGDAFNYQGDLAGPPHPETSTDCGLLTITTLEGDMTVTPMDFVIRGIQGEFYPCKPDIFAATYTEVHV